MGVLLLEHCPCCIKACKIFASLEGENSEAADPHHPVVGAEVLNEEPTDRSYAALLRTRQRRSSKNRDRQNSLM